MQISAVISTVHGALVGRSAGAGEPEPEPLRPAVPIKKSVTPEYIICLEDGKQLKMLKRHLRTTYDMTPEEYRAKWGLPANYPMVAPNYARQRSEFAKKRSEEHTSELQSLMRNSYAVFCLKQKKN